MTFCNYHIKIIDNKGNILYRLNTNKETTIIINDWKNYKTKQIKLKGVTNGKKQK